MLCIYRRRSGKLWISQSKAMRKATFWPPFLFLRFFIYTLFTFYAVPGVFASFPDFRYRLIKQNRFFTISYLLDIFSPFWYNEIVSRVSPCAVGFSKAGAPAAGDILFAISCIFFPFWKLHLAHSHFFRYNI